MTRTEWKSLDREYRILARLWYDTMLKNTKKADAIWNATIGDNRFEPIKSRNDLDLLKQREKGCFDLKKGRPYTTFANVDLP